MSNGGEKLAERMNKDSDIRKSIGGLEPDGVWNSAVWCNWCYFIVYGWNICGLFLITFFSFMVICTYCWRSGGWREWRRRGGRACARSQKTQFWWGGHPALFMIKLWMFLSKYVSAFIVDFQIIKCFIINLLKCQVHCWTLLFYLNKSILYSLHMKAWID